MATPPAFEAISEAHPELTPTLNILADLLAGEDERALYRLNPFDLAEAHHLEPRLVVDALLRATHAGVFQLSWGLVCRGCGSVVESFRSLGALDNHFFCPDCAKDKESVLDDSVDVAFTVHPDVRAIRFHNAHGLPLEEYFYEAYFGTNILMRDTGERFVDYLRSTEAFMAVIPAGTSHTVELELTEGVLVGTPRHKLFIEGEPTTETREVTLSFLEALFDPYGDTLAPGPVRITVDNPTGTEVRMFSYIADRVPYFAYRRFLSGADLLNNRTFRTLFKDQLLDISDAMPVRDVTLLFTDLTGSTAFYEKVGDARAFELVTEHFRRLSDIIGVHGGTIIKTMGDAVMASFSAPVDAVRAALSGLRAIASFNREVGQDGPALSLKVGVHRGPSIAVTVNDNVDYFGQTANIAARVQGCANADELCFSDAVYGDEKAHKVLAAYGDLPTEAVALKGVSEPTLIRRVKGSG